VPTFVGPPVEGPGQEIEPETAWGEGERIVGGYGRGARAIQAKADRKWFWISFGIGVFGSGVDEF